MDQWTDCDDAGRSNILLGECSEAASAMAGCRPQRPVEQPPSAGARAGSWGWLVRGIRVPLDKGRIGKEGKTTSHLPTTIVYNFCSLGRKLSCWVSPLVQDCIQGENKNHCTLHPWKDQQQMGYNYLTLLLIPKYNFSSLEWVSKCQIPLHFAANFCGFLLRVQKLMSKEGKVYWGSKQRVQNLVCLWLCPSCLLLIPPSQSLIQYNPLSLQHKRYKCIAHIGVTKGCVLPNAWLQVAFWHGEKGEVGAGLAATAPGSCCQFLTSM